MDIDIDPPRPRMSKSIYCPLKSFFALFELLGESAKAANLPAGPVPACVLGFHAALAQWNENRDITTKPRSIENGNESNMTIDYGEQEDANRHGARAHAVQIVPVELSELARLVDALEKPPIPTSLSDPWRWIATCSWYRASRSPAERRYAWTRLARLPMAIRLALKLGLYSTRRRVDGPSRPRGRRHTLIDNGDEQIYRLNHPLGCAGFASSTGPPPHINDDDEQDMSPAPDSDLLQAYTPEHVGELLEYRHALALAHLIAHRSDYHGGTDSDTIPLILPSPISFTRVVPSDGSRRDDETPKLEISQVKALRKVVKMARRTIKDMLSAHVGSLQLDHDDDDDDDDDDGDGDGKGTRTLSERLLAVLTIGTKSDKRRAGCSSTIWAMLELDSARAQARLFISSAPFRGMHDVAVVAEQVVGQVALALNDGEMPRLGYAIHITSLARLVNHIDSDLANSSTGPLAMRILDKLARLPYGRDDVTHGADGGDIGQSNYPGSLCASFDTHVERNIRAEQKAWISDDIQRQGMLYSSLVSGSALDALLRI